MLIVDLSVHRSPILICYFWFRGLRHFWLFLFYCFRSFLFYFLHLLQSLLENESLFFSLNVIRFFSMNSNLSVDFRFRKILLPMTFLNFLINRKLFIFIEYFMIFLIVDCFLNDETSMQGVSFMLGSSWVFEISFRDILHSLLLTFPIILGLFSVLLRLFNRIPILLLELRLYLFELAKPSIIVLLVSFHFLL